MRRTDRAAPAPSAAEPCATARAPTAARPEAVPRRPADAHEWVSFEDPEERAPGCSTSRSCCPVAVHLRPGLSGRADRPGRGDGPGLLLLRGPLHRRRGRGPGQGGGQDAAAPTSGSSPGRAGRRGGPHATDGAQVTRMVEGRASSSTAPASPAVRGAPCTGPPSSGAGAHGAQARRLLAAAAAPGGHDRRVDRPGDIDHHRSGTAATGAAAARSSTGGAPRRRRPSPPAKPVYQTMAAELTAMVGGAIYAGWSSYLAARQSVGVPLPHPVRPARSART